MDFYICLFPHMTHTCGITNKPRNKCSPILLFELPLNSTNTKDILFFYEQSCLTFKLHGLVKLLSLLVIQLC